MWARSDSILPKKRCPRLCYNNSSALRYLAMGPIPSPTNAKASILTLPVSNTAALTTAQAMFPELKVDSTFPTSQSIQQLTKPFPQYNGLTDVYESIGRTNYNAMQLTISKRQPIHGVSFSFSYTWDKEMDNVGTFRNGYEPMRAEWSPGTTDIPNYFTTYAVYDLPAGRGHLVGGDNALLSGILGGWRLTGTVYYATGYPVVVTTAGCNTGGTAGTCEPNLTPGYNGSPRVHGGDYGLEGDGGQRSAPRSISIPLRSPRRLLSASATRPEPRRTISMALAIMTWTRACGANFQSPAREGKAKLPCSEWTSSTFLTT